MKMTTELHKAAEKLDIVLCNTLIDAHPKSVQALNEEGLTPLHSLLKKLFSVHPKIYQSGDLFSLANLVRKMMASSPEMSAHLPSLTKLCYYEDVSFSGSYPTQRNVTAITIPQILDALSVSKNSMPKADEELQRAKELEDIARYQMGDAALADEIMIDRLLIETYKNAYIK